MGSQGVRHNYDWVTNTWMNIRKHKKKKKKKKKLFQLPHILRLKSKESAHNEGDRGDIGLIPGSGRFPWRRKMATHSSILAWKFPWTEEPGRLGPWGRTELDMTEWPRAAHRGGKRAETFSHQWMSLKIWCGH